MTEQLLSRRPEHNRTTRKVEPISARSAGPAWYMRVLLLVIIALGGALVGHIGSQVTAHLLSSRAVTPRSQASSSVSSLLSLAQSVPERLLEIDQHMSNRDFGTALLLCDEALTLFPGDTQLQGRRQRTEDELKNRFRYQMFEQAAARRNYAAALALWNEIPAESMYKARAMQALSRVRSHFMGERLAIAQAAARLGQCGEARLYAASVLALDSTSVSAHAVLDQCPAARPAERPE